MVNVANFQEQLVEVLAAIEKPPATTKLTQEKMPKGASRFTLRTQQVIKVTPTPSLLL